MEAINIPCGPDKQLTGHCIQQCVCVCVCVCVCMYNVNLSQYIVRLPRKQNVSQPETVYWTK